jgi:hypothetical protein
MNSKRLYFTLLAAIGLSVIALIGGAYGMSGLLQSQARQLSDDRLQIGVLDNQQTALNNARQDITKYADLANIVKSIVPQDKDQVQTVRQIVNIASTSGVGLSSISFPSSALGLKGGSLQLSQLTPVKGIAGLYDLQITVAVDDQHAVPYPNFVNFLTGLEQNRRTALVSNITITPNTKNRSLVAFKLVLDEYIKP